MEAVDDSGNGSDAPSTSFVTGDGFPLPAPDNIIPRPLTGEEEARIDTLSRLQFFLATAPTRWSEGQPLSASRITKFQLPNSECISCILWNGLYHITGTDIVRALAFRFEAFGRPIHATKKWEEGVFSDLRNLKPGQDACLEEPKSPLLDFLFRNGCIRTQKKQKVFYWFSVPHDRLFLDALERDLKREKVNQEPTSIVVGEPARSFKQVTRLSIAETQYRLTSRYDPRRSLYDQFAGQNPGLGTNYFVGAPGQPMGNEYGAQPPPHEPYFNGPPPMPLSLQPPPPGAGPPMGGMGGMPPQGQPSYTPYHPSYPPPGLHGPPPHAAPMGMAMPPHMPHMSPAPPHSMHMAPPVPRGPPRYSGFRPSAPLEGSPHYKRRRSRASRSPAVHAMGQHEDEESVRGNPDDSMASDESTNNRKKARSMSRAASVAASGITGRSGSVDSAGELRMYPCPYTSCRRPFRRLEHLRRHVRTHTQEKPFWCTRCPKKFARQDNLTNHLRVHDKHEGSGAEGDVSAEYDMDASEYEEEEGMNVEMVPREWSATPAQDMSRNVSGSSAGGSLGYNRHSTLPPKFPPNFAMYNPTLPPAAGLAPAGPGEFVPYQPGGASLYPTGLGMGAPMDSRRHRSATPYAPVTSSNLAYSQPVTAGSWSNDGYAGPDNGYASGDMTGSSSTNGMAPYQAAPPPDVGLDATYRSVSVDPGLYQPLPADPSGMVPPSNGAYPVNGDMSSLAPVPTGGAYVTSSTPLSASGHDTHLNPHLPGKAADGNGTPYMHPHSPAVGYQQQQLHISVPTPTTAITPMPNTAGTGVSVADSLLPQGKPRPLSIGIGMNANGNGHSDAGIAKAPGSASAVPSGWGWKSAQASTPQTSGGRAE